MPAKNENLNLSIETITPALAAAYLATGPNIRTFNSRHVGQLVQEIRNGQFRLNGETVKFNSNGVLIDGQHRLKAVVISGIPLTTVVVRGGVSEGVDEGWRRSGAGLLGGAGVKNSHVSASMTRCVIFLEAGRDPWMEAHTVPNRDLVSKWDALGNDAVQSVSVGVRCKKLINCTVAATFHYMASRKYLVKAVAEFIESIELGAGLPVASPRFIARSWMENRRRETGGSSRATLRACYIVLCRAIEFEMGERSGPCSPGNIYGRVYEAEIPKIV